MKVGLRESCFAENLLEQLHGAEAEVVYVTGIGDPILSPCVYFPLLSICIT